MAGWFSTAMFNYQSVFLADQNSLSFHQPESLVNLWHRQWPEPSAPPTPDPLHVDLVDLTRSWRVYIQSGARYLCCFIKLNHWSDILSPVIDMRYVYQLSYQIHHTPHYHQIASQLSIVTNATSPWHSAHSVGPGRKSKSNWRRAKLPARSSMLGRHRKGERPS